MKFHKISSPRKFKSTQSVLIFRKIPCGATQFDMGRGDVAQVRREPYSTARFDIA
nr:hypothetical protein [uncultured Campylobacter sp.]